MKRFQIDQINIRLRGVSSQTARSALAGLGNQVQRQFVEQGPGHLTAGRIQLSAIRPPVIRTQPGASAHQLREQIARAIHRSITREG